MVCVLAVPLAGIASIAPGASPDAPRSRGLPDRFGAYYSGPPCPGAHVDRTYSQFQVNLSPEEGMLLGDLVDGENGEALLAHGDRPPIRLVTNW